VVPDVRRIGRRHDSAARVTDRVNRVLIKAFALFFFILLTLAVFA
jgi:hypothetical protein